MNINRSELSLPMNSLKFIPTPLSNAKTITGLQKKSGKVTGYQLSDGSLVSKQQGLDLTRQGAISGVGIAVRSGNEYLKSLPDGNEASNLSNLPTVSTPTASM